MNNDHFQDIMQTWFKLELKKVPELKPSEAMYELLRENTQKKRSVFRHASWYFPAAAVLLFAFLTVTNYQRIFYPKPLQAVELGIRSNVEDKEEISFERSFKAHKSLGLSQVAAKGKAADEVIFHFQRHGSFYATEVDMTKPLEYPIGLQQEDNYRISVKPASNSYLYIFQLNSEGNLMKLFPDDENGIGNPLEGSKQLMLPGENEWYHLDERTGEESVYLCISQEKSDELLQMYRKYIRTRSTSRREKILNQLLENLNKMSTGTMLLENQ